jgi:SAM-dependent methyltransferase
MRPDLPGPAQSKLLADWLAGPRGRLLRKAQIGLRRRVLEVGSGHGHVTVELARRAAGPVVALDAHALLPSTTSRSILPLQGRAEELPFGEGSFDLVFFQNVLMWTTGPARALAEAARVTKPGGVVVALEPDYGGMLEYPPRGLAEVWQAVLRRNSAEPLMGRRLPVLAQQAGLRVWLELTHVPQPWDSAALGLLQGLELTANERETLRHLADKTGGETGPWSYFVHLPYVLLLGRRPE